MVVQRAAALPKAGGAEHCPDPPVSEHVHHEAAALCVCSQVSSCGAGSDASVRHDFLKEEGRGRSKRPTPARVRLEGRTYLEYVDEGKGGYAAAVAEAIARPNFRSLHA